MRWNNIILCCLEYCNRCWNKNARFFAGVQRGMQLWDGRSWNSCIAQCRVTLCNKYLSNLLRSSTRVSYSGGPYLAPSLWHQEETWRSCGASHIWLWEWLRWELDRSLCCKYEVFFSFFVVAVSTCCECYEAMNSHVIQYVAFSSFWDFQVSLVRWWNYKQILLKMTLWYSLYCLSTGIQQIVVTC